MEFEKYGMKSEILAVIRSLSNHFVTFSAKHQIKNDIPSRKLRHTAEASLTVFTAEKGGGVQKLLISMFFNVL